LKKGDAKIIFRVHNFEILHNYDKAKINAGDGLYNWLKMAKKGWRRWLSILFSERLMLKLSDKILCISWGDFQLYKKIFKTMNVVYFPPYLGDLTEVSVKDKEVLDVFYMGSDFSNNLNRSGAEYLIQNIIPMVNKAFPEKFRFHVIGKGSKLLYGQTRIANLIIHDFIDDIEPFYNDMDISCIPVKEGRGCKIKMFEALAKGLPTIGFKRTFSGIQFERNCFIYAENDKEYVKAFEKLLSLTFRQKMSRNAKKKIAEITNKGRILTLLQRVLKG
jgi:glycosyltransferase involved in cell wall biosynthesis